MTASHAMGCGSDERLPRAAPVRHQNSIRQCPSNLLSSKILVHTHEVNPHSKIHHSNALSTKTTQDYPRNKRLEITKASREFSDQKRLVLHGAPNASLARDTFLVDFLD